MRSCVIYVCHVWSMSVAGGLWRRDCDGKFGAVMSADTSDMGANESCNESQDVRMATGGVVSGSERMRSEELGVSVVKDVDVQIKREEEHNRSSLITEIVVEPYVEGGDVVDQEDGGCNVQRHMSLIKETEVQPYVGGCDVPDEDDGGCHMRGQTEGKCNMSLSVKDVTVEPYLERCDMKYEADESEVVIGGYCRQEEKMSCVQKQSKQHDGVGDRGYQGDDHNVQLYVKHIKVESWVEDCNVIYQGSVKSDINAETSASGMEVGVQKLDNETGGSLNVQDVGPELGVDGGEQVLNRRETLAVGVPLEVDRGEHIGMIAAGLWLGCGMQDDATGNSGSVVERESVIVGVVAGERDAGVRGSEDACGSEPLMTIIQLGSNVQRKDVKFEDGQRQERSVQRGVDDVPRMEMHGGFSKFPCKYAYKGCRKATLQKYNTAQHECSCKYRDRSPVQGERREDRGNT